jgi:DNA-binding MarR family transcriptional regulator
VTPDAIAAIRAWTRLDQAMTAFNKALEREYGVTGAQLAVLRMVGEWAGAAEPPSSGRLTSGSAPLRPRAAGVVPLAAMRERLVMHPATLGQLLDRLAARGLVAIEPDPADRRRRLVGLTEAGRDLRRRAPLAGPVRLRYVEASATRLRRLAEALDDAVVLFGLEEYRHDGSGDPGEHRAEARGRPAQRRGARRGDAAGGGRAGGGPAAG